MTSRPSASGGDDRERREGDASPTPPVDPADYGFLFDEPGDGWLESVRDAETPVSLGSIGDYELIAEVSRGGQGVVFLARQPGTHRTIALKRLRAGTLSTAAMQQRFQREVEAAAALNHPNIVTVYGMEVVDGLPVFAMEWVDGVPVTEWAAHGEDDERRDPSEMLELFLRICDAVQHAHSRGVLHRDLKPSNILVDECGQPHVLDFGLAMRLEPDATGEILETPAFLDADPGCVSCHKKDDQHAGKLGPNCASCHSPVDWARWRFDHSTQTDFPLTGRHQNVTCEGCHKTATDNPAISDRCVSCHAADDKHRGSFGTSCERCHNTTTFRDAEVRR